MIVSTKVQLFPGSRCSVRLHCGRLSVCHRSLQGAQDVPRLADSRAPRGTLASGYPLPVLPAVGGPRSGPGRPEGAVERQVVPAPITELG